MFKEEVESSPEKIEKKPFLHRADKSRSPTPTPKKERIMTKKSENSVPRKINKTETKSNKIETLTVSTDDRPDPGPEKNLVRQLGLKTRQIKVLELKLSESK